MKDSFNLSIKKSIKALVFDYAYVWNVGSNLRAAQKTSDFVSELLRHPINDIKHLLYSCLNEKLV